MSELENKKLLIDDTEYETRFTFKFLNRKKYEAPNPKEIKAFIPGTIRKIFIKAGDEVKTGDSLLILEAMKMMNDVKAEFDGRIKAVHVASDQTVMNKQLLIEFE